MKKVTRGRNYHHQPILKLIGTAILAQVGSPNQSRLMGTVKYEKRSFNGVEQDTNCLKFIPFEHDALSGKDAKKNFEKSLAAHKEKVNKELKKFPSYAITMNKYKKTSHIIKHEKL